MRTLHPGGLAAALTLSLGLATGATAATWSQVDDLPGIIEQSSLSFRGVVAAIDYREILIGDEAFPYTETLFVPSECFSGCRAGKPVIVRQMGGVFSSVAQRAVLVPGLPDYVSGAEYFVFADPDRHALFGARFGENGAFRVAKIDGQADTLVFDALGSALRIDGAGVIDGKSGVRCTDFGDAGTCAASERASAKSTAAALTTADAFANYARAIKATSSPANQKSANQNDAAFFERALTGLLSGSSAR